MIGRFKTLTAMLGGAAALIAPIVLEITPLYVWNASESVPFGLYRLRPVDSLFRHGTPRRTATGAACKLPRPERLSAGQSADA